MTRSLVLLSIILTVGLLVAYTLLKPSDEMTANPMTAPETTVDQDQPDSQEVESITESQAARYISYSPDKLAASETDINLIFFHAVWCSVCQSVERAIQAAPVPEEVTIFKVDYDSDEGQSLARKYSIPIQYTTVQVDTEGNELTQWINQYNDGVSEMLARSVDAS